MNSIAITSPVWKFRPVYWSILGFFTDGKSVLDIVPLHQTLLKRIFLDINIVHGVKPYKMCQTLEVPIRIDEYFLILIEEESIPRRSVVYMVFSKGVAE